MKITAKQAVELLDAIHSDPEGGHIEAEQILLNFLDCAGFSAVAAAFRRVKERNRFWYA